MPDSPTTQAQRAQSVNTAQTLAENLLLQNLITKEQYSDIKVKSATKGVSEESTIESMEIVSPLKLAQTKALMLGIPFIDIANSSLSPEALGKVPRAVAERFSFIPFAYDDSTKTLSIAMGNPVDLEAITFVREKTGLNIKSFAATPMDVAKAINQQYRQELVGESGITIIVG